MGRQGNRNTGGDPGNREDRRGLCDAANRSQFAPGAAWRRSLRLANRRDQMNAILASLGLILAAGLWSSEAAAQNRRIDASACRDQAQAFARLDIDCTLTIRAGEKDLERAPFFLQALIGNLECKIPLKFDKSKVYGVWITETRVNPPPLTVACTVPAGPNPGIISGTFDADCVRSEGQWTCHPGLSDVQGLGPLAPVVEQFVNEDQIFSRFLAKQLDKFD